MSPYHKELIGQVDSLGMFDKNSRQSMTEFIQRKKPETDILNLSFADIRDTAYRIAIDIIQVRQYIADDCAQDDIISRMIEDEERQREDY